LYVKRMRRYHLFEFEDLNGFPDVWRRAMTRYLKTAVNLFRCPECGRTNSLRSGRVKADFRS